MALSPRKLGEGLYQPLADINVTPLVDVMLVLLIIFMVTAPMLATGIKVNLPSAKTAQPLDNKQPVVVAVAKDGALSVGKDPVSRDELAAKVKAKLTDSNGVVQLRGDRDAAYGDVVSVMDELAANGISRIAIVSGPRRAVSPVGRDKRAKPCGARHASPSRAERAGAVTAATLDGRVFEPPPVRPPWLRPLVIAIVIALHAAALSIVYLAPQPVELPREVVVDIQTEAPPAETPAPPAEQPKPPEQSAPPPAQDAAPAPTAPPPPTPVTPPVAEQPPPPPVEQPPLPTPEPPPPAAEPPPPVAEQPPPPPVEQPPLPIPEPPPPPTPVELAPPPPPPKTVAPPRPKPPLPRAEAPKPQPKPTPKLAPTARPAETQSRSAAAPAQASRGASSASAPSSAAASASSLSAYIGEVSAAIRSRLFYPPAARARGAKGVVGVSFHHRPVRRGELVCDHPFLRR